MQMTVQWRRHRLAITQQCGKCHDKKHEDRKHEARIYPKRKPGESTELRDTQILSLKTLV